MPNPTGPAPENQRPHVYRNRDGVPFLARSDGPGGASRWEQLRPDGSTARAGLMGVAVPPYRLDALAAAGHDDWACVCDHEDDADALSALGMVATHVPPEVDRLDDFRGRKVALFPRGNDRAAEGATLTAARLLGTAAEVRVITLPGLKWYGGLAEYFGRQTNWTRDLLLAEIDISEDFRAPESEPEPEQDLCEPSASGPEEEEEGEPILARPWPEPPGDDAFSGLAGEIVGAIAPETEADPLALLAQLLISFGNITGRKPFVAVGQTRHYGNENVVFTGETALGRKGTADAWVRALMEKVEERWVRERIKGGLSSGEGLIFAVRDEVHGKEAIREKGRVVGYQDVVQDPGVADKRLMVIEDEFASVLHVMKREGNKIGAVLRQTWDHGNLSSLTKSPLKATGAHVSIIGHITAEELLSLLSTVDVVNGLANRFLWLAVRRSKVLPFGGEALDLGTFAGRLAEAVAFARDIGQMSWTCDAAEQWKAEYPRLTTPPPGTLGKVLSRAAPHVLRLAMQYALLARNKNIESRYLAAGLALWDASARCAAYIFGERLGDPDAESILKALRQVAPAGMSRSEIRTRVFQRHKPSHQVGRALSLLLQGGQVRYEMQPTAGRSRQVWYAACAKSAIGAASLSACDPPGQPAGDYRANGAYGAGADRENTPPEPRPRERGSL
jgi:hypothetical protein